jgi:hypothetical protein
MVAFNTSGRTPGFAMGSPPLPRLSHAQDSPRRSPGQTQGDRGGRLHHQPQFAGMALSYDKTVMHPEAENDLLSNVQHDPLGHLGLLPLVGAGQCPYRSRARW